MTAAPTPHSLEKLLRARAAHFRAPLQLSAHASDRNDAALVVPVGGLEVLVPFEPLVAIIRHPTVSPVPTTRSAYLGLVPFRSRFLDLFDLGALLGLPKSETAADAAYLLRLPGGECALAAALPSGVLPSARESLRPVESPDWPAAIRHRAPGGAYLLAPEALNFDA